MDKVPVYEQPSSRDQGGFNSNLRTDAIETADTYLRERIDADLKYEERFLAISELANELAEDSGNVYIVRALRERLSLEKSALELQAESIFV